MNFFPFFFLVNLKISFIHLFCIERKEGYQDNPHAYELMVQRDNPKKSMKRKPPNQRSQLNTNYCNRKFRFKSRQDPL